MWLPELYKLRTYTIALPHAEVAIVVRGTSRWLGQLLNIDSSDYRRTTQNNSTAQLKAIANA